MAFSLIAPPPAAGNPSVGPQTSVSPSMAAMFQSNPSTLNGTPMPTVTTGGTATTSPVITSQTAQSDLAQKQSTFNAIQAANAQQSAALAQKQLTDQQNKAAADQQALAQKNVDTQNAQKQQEIDAKSSALGLIAPPPPAPPPVKLGTQNNQVGVTPTTGTPSNTQTTPSTNPIQDALDSSTGTYLNQQSNIQSEQDQLANQVNTQLNSVLAGTFPLSSTQSALIGSLQAQLAQNTLQQQTANASYTGAVSEAAFRSGGEYTPAQMAGQIANAVSYGTTKIQDLDNSATQTMATLEQGFQKDDFDMINTQYQTLSKQLDDKSNSIKDMYDTVTASLKDQRDTQAAAAKTEFDENLQSQTFDLTKAQDQIDNMFKQGQITETERHDMADEANQAAQTQIAQQKQNIDQATFNVQYGSFLNPDGTPNTSVNPTQIQGYTQLPNGMPIIDNTSGVYKSSSLGGIPVTSASDFKTVSTAATAANTLNQMQLLFNKINSGQNSGTNDTQYKVLLATLPADVQKMVPNVGMFTGGVFSGSSASANTQFNAAFNSLNGQISSVSPNAAIPAFGQVFKTMSDAGNYLKSTGQESVYNNYKEQGYSDQQILQIINGQ